MLYAKLISMESGRQWHNENKLAAPREMAIAELVAPTENQKIIFSES